jgi:hypothetical protein
LRWNRTACAPPRALFNKEARGARKVARDELAATVLHPDVGSAGADLPLAHLSPHLERFTVELDRYLKGEIDLSA